jgi:hypothetical protein
MIVPLIRTLVIKAAKKAATDPRVQRQAVELARKAVPHVQAAARSVGAAAREASPLRDPKGFARNVRDRISGKSE